MSADGGGAVYPYPRGKTTEHLYAHAKALVDSLNRVRTADHEEVTQITVDMTAIQELIDLINATLADIEENGGLTEQQEFMLDLVTAVDTVIGSVSHLVTQTYLDSQKAAEATIQSLLKGQRNQVDIRIEQTARLTANEAFAQQITSVLAQISLAQAAITQEITARSTGDSALAQSIGNVSTALNGNVLQVQTIQSSVDGLEGRFGIAINSNGQVIGLVQLDGTPLGSTFTVVANKFLVAQPGVTGGNPVPVFAIGNVDGVTKLVLRGDIHATGSISASKLAVAALSAITANLGTVTAGLIRNVANTLRFDLPNMRIYRPDGKFDLDAKNLRFRMGTG